MRKFYKSLIITILLILATTNIYAHGGNISGWNNKNSDLITYYDKKHYGYHKEKDITHYHQVKWNEEKNKWEIINPAVYYEKVGKEIKLLRNVIDKDLLAKKATFVKKVDGDTADFNIDGKTIRVRFLGINTTESVAYNKPVEAYSKEASNFTETYLKNATEIRLEFDYDDNIFYEENSNKNRDMYGRLLAWVFVDDTLLQEELVKNGLAYTYMLSNSQKYAGVLQQAEEYAKEQQLNLWSDTQYILSEENNHTKNSDNYTQEAIIITIALIIVGIIIYIMRKVI